MPDLQKEFRNSYECFREKRDRAFGRGAPDASTADMFDHLDGLKPARGPFLASNGVSRELLTGRMLQSFRTLHDQQPGLEFAHVTVYNHAWTTSDEVTRVNLSGMRDCVAPLLAEISPHWSAIVEMQAFTNVRHQLGGKALSPHIHATLWGPLAHSSVKRIQREINGSWASTVPGGSPFRLQIVGPTFMDLARTVRYPLKAHDRCKTVYVHCRTGRVNVHGSEAGDRYVRYLRIFQLLSLTRQRDLMFAGGDGVALQQDALQAVRDRRRQEAQRSRARILKIPSVRDFWAKVMGQPAWLRFQPPVISA